MNFDPILLKVKKKLNNYFCYFKHENILVISEDKAVLPFAYLIHDKETHPHFLLISLAIDYPNTYNVAEITLLSNSVKRVALGEQFFISKDGTTYLGEDAHKYYSIETQLSIEDLEPTSKVHH